MKRIISTISILAAAAIAAVSCRTDDPVLPVDQAITGEWHLTETEVEGEVLDTELIDVYLVISPDGQFELYQKNGTMTRYAKYTGECTTYDGRLKGTYSDGSPFGSEYRYTVSGSSLTLKSSDALETQRYVKEALSEKIKENAYLITKSQNTENKPIL